MKWACHHISFTKLLLLWLFNVFFQTSMMRSLCKGNLLNSLYLIPPHVALKMDYIAAVTWSAYNLSTVHLPMILLVADCITDILLSQTPGKLHRCHQPWLQRISVTFLQVRSAMDMTWCLSGWPSIYFTMASAKKAIIRFQDKTLPLAWYLKNEIRMYPFVSFFCAVYVCLMYFCLYQW